MTRREWMLLAPAFAPSLRGEERPTPEAHFKRAVSNPALLKAGLGESFCWNGAFYLSDFVTAYQAWQDTAWLDWGVRYYEFLADRMQTGPDGYKGWIGPYMYDDKVWCDVHVGDAILFNGLLGFAEVVLADNALKSKYGGRANGYVEMARKHLFEKWDARGTWEQDGPFGGYRAWNRYGEPGNLKDWPVREDIKNSRLSLPFNKQNDMAIAALRLYRITGETQFRRRAEQIFAFHKSRMQVMDDCLLWNYWEPMGAEDVDQAKRQTRHWVGVHPYRNYQEGEVSQIVEAYHSGIVFSREDIERIIRTNLKVMWNGDLSKPAFRNSNATLPGTRGQQTAGTLWGALSDFDDTVRKLRAGGRAMGRAYFENVTLKRPAGFERRKLRGAPTVFDCPQHPCASINMAAALPSRLKTGQNTTLAANALVRGPFEVALYSGGGAEKLQVLASGERVGQVFTTWKPERPGDFRIRWTSGDQWREAVVAVR